MQRALLIAFCLVLAVATYTLTPAPVEQRLGLLIFVLIAALWLTQALPLPLTALLVPVLATVLGVAPLRETLTAFADPIIFLFLGGFSLAAALSIHGLDRLLAAQVLRLARGSRLAAIVLLSALAAGMSMWISNTATAAMLLPLAIGLTRAVGDAPALQLPARRFTLLALAYGSSIGGMATLVGSPPNAIAAAHIGLSFREWLHIGLPLATLLWPLMLITLWLTLRPRIQGRLHPETEPVVWTRQRSVTLAIFVLTILGWVSSGWLGERLGILGDLDAWVALAAVILLVASGVLPWPSLESHTQWGVLLLFGGGLALSQVAATSGASVFMANSLLGLFGEASPALLLLALITFVVFLSALVSNTAATALMLPLLLPIAQPMGLDPVVVAAAIALAASCAFMLPVATPANAMVFATGDVPQTTMLRCGLVLNLVCIAVIAVVAISLPEYWPTVPRPAGGSAGSAP